MITAGTIDRTPTSIIKVKCDKALTTMQSDLVVQHHVDDAPHQYQQGFGSFLHVTLHTPNPINGLVSIIIGIIIFFYDRIHMMRT